MLTGQTLTIEEAKKVLYGEAFVSASAESVKKVEKSREAVENIVKQKESRLWHHNRFWKVQRCFD